MCFFTRYFYLTALSSESKVAIHFNAFHCDFKHLNHLNLLQKLLDR